MPYQSNGIIYSEGLMCTNDSVSTWVDLCIKMIDSNLISQMSFW